MCRNNLYKFYRQPKPVREMSEDEFEEWYLKYNAIKLTLLNRLSESQNHRCAYCGARVWLTEDDRNGEEKWQRASFDHITPKSRGGNDKLKNLVVACRECNSSRGDQNAYKFFKKITDPNYKHPMPMLKKSVRQKGLNCMALYLISKKFFPEDVERLLIKLGPDYDLGLKRKIPGESYRRRVDRIRRRIINFKIY